MTTVAASHVRHQWQYFWHQVHVVCLTACSDQWNWTVDIVRFVGWKCEIQGDLKHSVTTCVTTSCLLMQQLTVATGTTTDNFTCKMDLVQFLQRGLSVQQAGILSKRLNISHLFWTSGSHTILRFPYQIVWQYSDGDPLMGTMNAGVWKYHNFWPISHFIS